MPFIYLVALLATIISLSNGFSRRHSNNTNIWSNEADPTAQSILYKLLKAALCILLSLKEIISQFANSVFQQSKVA